MEELKIRELREQDARAVLKGQRKAFSPLFGLFLSRPKEGLVAEYGGRIVGAVTCKVIPVGKGRAGYLDIAYVDSSQRGKKLGSRLYTAAMEKLRDEGCETITAVIRDDNRASWKIMERNGCVIYPFYRLIGKFGLAGALRIGANAHIAYALGHELWATGKPSGRSKSHQSPLAALPGFIIINFLLVLLASRGSLPFTLGAMIAVAAEIAGGWLGTLGQPARWYLQRPHAALPLSMFVALTRGLLPSNASWQPVEETYDVIQRPRLLGRTSLFAWIAVYLVTVSSFIVLNPGSLTSLLNWMNLTNLSSLSSLQTDALSGSLSLGLMYLIYRTLAVFPFESFGGLRVYEWKPRIFWLMAGISALTIAAIFFLMP
jgi:GNAT superfamily N-acetyltransferase